MVALNGDDVDAVNLAHVQFADGAAQQLAAHGDAAHLDAVIQGDVIQKIARNQPLANAHGHVGLRVNHRGTQALEHLAVHLAGGFGNDLGHAQFDDQHRGQDADVHLLADAHRNRAAVLHAGLFDGVLAQIIHHKRVVGIAAHGLDLLLVFINGDDLFARFGQRLHQCRAEPSQADHAVNVGFQLFFHLIIPFCLPLRGRCLRDSADGGRDITIAAPWVKSLPTCFAGAPSQRGPLGVYHPIVMASSVYLALGSGRETQRDSSVNAPTRPMNMVAISTALLAACRLGVMPIVRPAVL